MDLAARQAGVAQRVEVDDVVGLVDDLGDLPAHLVELGGLQPQLEDGLLQPVAPALQRGGQASPPRWRSRERLGRLSVEACSTPSEGSSPWAVERRALGQQDRVGVGEGGRWPGPWVGGDCVRRRRPPVGPVRTGS